MGTSGEAALRDATRQAPAPATLVERVLAPFQKFARTASSGGLVLLAVTAVAFAWANSPWADSYHHFWETEVTFMVGSFDLRATLHQVVNDGLMAVFFFLVGLEIKREAIAGELASWRRAALPAAAAFGGMVVPAMLYATLNAGGPGEPGWGTPMATDIAFSLGVLALLGDRVPVGLKVFLAALAIVDDIGAVLVIAIFYTGGVAWGPLAVAGALLVLSLAANTAGVRKPWAYWMIGLALWVAVLASGVHATVAGVLLAMTIPARTRINEREFLDSARETLADFDAASVPDGTILTNAEHQAALQRLETLCDQAQAPLQRLEHSLHGIVAFGIMPLFALANAGVTLGGGGATLGSRVAFGVILGLVLGKPIGITLASWLAVRGGIAELPSGVTWRAVHGVAWLGGIGFTMSLFIAGLAFGGAPDLLGSAKLGILTASITASVVGWLVVRGALGRRSDEGPVA